MPHASTPPAQAQPCQWPAGCDRPATHTVAEADPLSGREHLCAAHVPPTVAAERKYLEPGDFTVAAIGDLK